MDYTDDYASTVGAAAFRAGLSFNANPYNEQTQPAENASWLDGWQGAKDDLVTISATTLEDIQSRSRTLRQSPGPVVLRFMTDEDADQLYEELNSHD